jgi:hypothetical protein
MAMKRRDANQVAFDTLQQAIGAMPKQDTDRKAQAAELGRKGGLKGGMARSAALTPERRAEIAKNAAEKRWKKTTR